MKGRKDPKDLLDSAARERMRAAGAWMQNVRKKRGLSQQQLATALGLKRLQSLSQIETGYVRLNPDLFRLWSQAMGLPERDVAQLLMSFYTPDLYRILFDGSPPDPEFDFPVAPIERRLEPSKGDL